MPIYPEPSAPPHPVLREQPESAEILVAEDPFVSSFLRTVLERRGYKVVIGGPVRAIAWLRQGSATPQIVITNQPEDFLAFAGTLPLLYIAASPDPALASPFAACRVLRKPFRNDDLLEAVEELARCVVA